MSGSSGTGTTAGRRASTRTWPPIRRTPASSRSQYWFYYTFNDFTDKHESDWEMAQVDFAASSAAAALRVGPYEVDLSQHAGGERSAWTDTKLQKDGTHPVIYDATGSHANYFGRALYLGRGAREGFGCDDTRDATRAAAAQDRSPAGRPVIRLGARTRGSGSKDAGARRREASTTARPVPRLRSSGWPRSSGRTGCARRASRSRAARRSV